MRMPKSTVVGDWDEACDCGTVDVEDLYNVLAKRGRGHAVPWWSAARVAWRLLLVGNATARCALLCERLRWVLILVLFVDAAPTLWCVSLVARVDKQNHRGDCAQWRLLQLLGPVGCAWAAMLWKRQHYQFDAAQCGFVHGRQRLHAVFQIRVQRWRARQAGSGSLTCFYDQINACPSMSWKLLHEATCSRASLADRRLLTARFT